MKPPVIMIIIIIIFQNSQQFILLDLNNVVINIEEKIQIMNFSSLIILDVQTLMHACRDIFPYYALFELAKMKLGLTK